MKKTFLAKLFLALAIMLMHRARAVPIAEPEPPARGRTMLYLDYSDPAAYVTAPSHVTVPAGEEVLLRVNAGPADSTLQWWKNGRPIVGGEAIHLSLPNVTAADAGKYSVVFSRANGETLTSQSLLLGVGPAERLVNLSTLSTLAAGPGASLTSGFVVTGHTGKKIIVRAVGPSLSLFGIPNALRQPVLRIRDSLGRIYENNYVYPAVIGGPTYETDLAQSLVAVGAFTIPAGSADAVRLMPFVPGDYTVQVTSADNSAGAVLLEIYEVP